MGHVLGSSISVLGWFSECFNDTELLHFIKQQQRWNKPQWKWLGWHLW